MSDTVSGNETNEQGVKASEQTDTNNYEAMYKSAQSGHDKYESLMSKYG